MRVVKEAIVIFPNSINIPPKPEIAMNLAACFNTKTKASIAD